MIEKNAKKFLTFWNDERELLLERNPQGFRAIDVGPVTMGYRASSSRTGGDITRRLIYPKGAYILHMIRMMMYDRQNGDKQFKETMQDFVNTYRGKAASTEDFKAIVEKHMTPEMDAEENHKMDWFFNEYVYGTELPNYKLDYSFDTGADGMIVMNLNVAESGVDDKFRMVVPVYLELDDGRIVFQVNRNDHAELVVHAGLGDVQVHHDHAVRAGVEGIVQLVVGEFGAIDVLVEEPVHLVILFGIHLWSHVLFNDGLEVFRAGRFAAVGVDEVLHGFLELLVPILPVVHHHADHVENISAFRVNEPPRDVSAGAGAAGAVAHGNRPDVDGPKSLRVALQQ